MFWTLTLIGVVKYASIALKADDHREGGTFVLYSLLCRKMNIGIRSSKHTGMSSRHPQSTLSEGTETPTRLGKFLEKSIFARQVLVFVAMLGMGMLIDDSILTPAIS
ncbi:hypothetical protein Droror1_Dr00012150, partial [Drosera rotundifolia]